MNEAGSEASLADARRRMQQALTLLHQEFSALRAGRASPAMLEHIKVDAYGALSPLNQLAAVAAPQARLLTVQVWDKQLVDNVVKAIRDADLGLNPSASGQLVRAPVPELSGERRQDLARRARQYAEQTRIAIRNIRRDLIDGFKASSRKGDMSEDALHSWQGRAQKLTDSCIEEVNLALAHKEKDIGAD